jgi:prepilin peptidase CpaA
MSMSPEMWSFAVVVGSLTLATAVTDLRFRRIPNWMCLLAFVAGIAWQAYFFGWAGLRNGGGGFLVGFTPLFAAWLLGGNGAGDAKLLGALGMWFGLAMTLVLLVSSVTLMMFFKVAAWVFRSAKRGRPVIVSEQTESGSKDHMRLMPFAVPVTLASWCVGAAYLIKLSAQQ